ncbi:MAG: L-arabinose transporter permease protein [Elusimicrobia bacterium ADurb.Bin231]|nr:MAG: L-arabinose transporter permease protein [Elusimicrobia bacterium ADurb.Bin231]
MSDILGSMISLAFLSQVIRISVPYVLAGMGGVFSERSGIVNIALEGMMLNGAFAYVLGTFLTGDPVAGVISGVLCGMLTGLVHGIVSIRFKANQIISGVAINLLSVGMTKYFLKIFFDSSSNSARVAGIESFSVLPYNSEFADTINGIFGNPLIILTIAIVVFSHLTIFKTVFGLRLRSVGEHPEAADTLGVKVNLIRYMCVILSGALAGLGGVWLAVDQHQFTDGMSNGRGFIALAAVIFGKWSPIGVAFGCLLFGFAESMQITLQSSGADIPTQFVQMIPYVLTIIALAGFIGKSMPPAASGVVFEKDN